MNIRWLKYICDPIDKSDLRIVNISKRKADEIIEAELWSETGNHYYIKNGIPILLTRGGQTKESVESFGYEWRVFDFGYGKSGWLKHIIEPSIGDQSYFQNKRIIDCGAGSGRQSIWMAESGAKFVLAIELSDAVDAIRKRIPTNLRDKIFVIQADIANLPINSKKEKFDLFYCVNVIQHTKNPSRTLLAIARAMSQSSFLLFNIYVKENKNLKLAVIHASRGVFKHFPNFLLKDFSYLIAIPVYFLLGFGHSYKETALDFYDLLGNHKYQRFYSRREVGDLIKKSGLKIVIESKYISILSLK